MDEYDMHITKTTWSKQHHVVTNNLQVCLQGEEVPQPAVVLFADDEDTQVM